MEILIGAFLFLSTLIPEGSGRYLGMRWAVRGGRRSGPAVTEPTK
jgi:hypothetical protein